MASLGHVIVGVAASRIERVDTARTPLRRGLSATTWALLSLLPDADVAGFAMGVRYEDEWGHRGATHSFAFALLVSAIVALVAPRLHRPRVRTGVLAAIVLASHPLLDTLTDGGLGCALFWPFSLTRYFAPWRPIPVAPIGLAFFSAEGLFCSAVEMALFAPVLWLAFEYERRSTATAVRRWPMRRLSLALAWLVGVWGATSFQSVRDGLFGFVMREDTVYAARFSEEQFDTIAAGDTREQVRAALGPPLRELFFFRAPAPATPGCYTVHVQDGTVVTALDAVACRARGVVVGTKSEGPPESLGLPVSHCWAYTWSPGRRLFRARGLCFENERVSDIIRQWAREGP